MTTEASAGNSEIKKRTLGGLVSVLARSLERELSAGDVAALRRLDPDDPACAPFWKLCATHLSSELPVGTRRSDAERRWAVVLSAMARLRGLHTPRQRLGAALAAAEFSELRFLRLLRARGGGLRSAVRATASFLASKAVPVDITDIARLVLSEGRRDEQDVRRDLARGFYAHAERG